MSTFDTTRMSWEYLMPKRRERMALYIRESDPRLATSTTIESQAKLVREYGEKEAYLYDPELEFREAISSVEIPYMLRPKLQEVLDAAKKKLFDVLVVSEIRAISRRQVEVLVIYDMLQKYGIRLETVKEKFGEDAMSKAILSLRAMFVEVEVEQSKMPKTFENGKYSHYEKIRPAEEWIPLPACDPVITKDTFDRIQFNLQNNKQESLRNNQLEPPGLVRSGYIFCSICGGRMGSQPPSKASGGISHFYQCRKRMGKNAPLTKNHLLVINMTVVDTAVKAKIAETLSRRACSSRLDRSVHPFWLERGLHPARQLLPVSMDGFRYCGVVPWHCHRTQYLAASAHRLHLVAATPCPHPARLCPGNHSWNRHRQ
jgi:hypothetical protein